VDQHALDVRSGRGTRVDGVVLRYGHLYGPGTGADAAEMPSLHVDAAASAALLAIEKARRGIYNIA
jgi:nucleoside-diphosphate-sugar epimerase